MVLERLKIRRGAQEAKRRAEDKQEGERGSVNTTEVDAQISLQPNKTKDAGNVDDANSQGRSYSNVSLCLLNF